jgi:hypothetical protein
MKAAGGGKPVVLALMLLLTVSVVSGAVSSQLSVQPVFAIPPDSGWFAGKCTEIAGGDAKKCCWSDPGDGKSWCQICRAGNTGVVWDCDEKTEQQKIVGGRDIVPPVEEGLAPPPPPGPGQGGPGNVLPEGVFEGPTTPPQQRGLTPEVAPPTAPEGDNDDETQGHICNPFCTPICPQCIPPSRTTDTGTSEEAESPIPPPTGPLGETAPQAAPPTAEDGSEQPPTQPLCPEGQVLDEDTNLCVPVPQEQEEQQQQPQVKEEEPQPEEDQSSDENNDN